MVLNRNSEWREEAHVRKERNERVAIMTHFRPLGQAIGLSGSLSAGSSHHTEKASSFSTVFELCIVVSFRWEVCGAIS